MDSQQQVEQRAPNVLLPVKAFQILLGGSRGVPRLEPVKGLAQGLVPALQAQRKQPGGLNHLNRLLST